MLEPRPAVLRQATVACAFACALATTVSVQAQSAPGGRAVPTVRDAVATDTLPALHTIRPVTPPIDGVRELPRKTLPNRIGAVAPDGVTETLAQDSAPSAGAPSVGVGFDGLSNRNGVLPPDPTGAAGPNHFVQAVNLSLAIYDRNGAVLYGPVNTNALWSGFGGPCQDKNSGDPVVLYDRLADRFVVSQFALPNFPAGPFYECIAVSQSPDPTGAWHRYAFLVSNTKMNDYPKLAVWPDGYYMSMNQFNQSSLQWGGAGAVAFERDKMLSGQPARMIYFDLYSVNPNLGGMLPADWDDATAPSVVPPNTFAEADDGAWGYTGGQDQLWLWSFQANWNSPLNSTFTSNAVLPTAPFDSNLCGYARSCIPQPGTTVKLDAISDRLMFRMPYRRLNAGSDQRLVLNHSVDSNGSDRAGVRWYELQNTGGGWTIRQQGTYAPPDGQNRWMGSIAMNDSGDIALAYSVSSTSVSPSLRFTGRLAGDPLGQMTQAETTIVDGSGAQTHSASRWGDYAQLSNDPVDNSAFWFTGEYTNSVSSASWRTRIAQLSLVGGAPPPSVQSDHVGDLGASTSLSKRAWKASVTATVHDASHAAVANATVSGTWSGGYSGGGSCVTGSGGTCTVTSGNISTSAGQVTFTVTAVSHASYAYDAGANHDPDGDSTGTMITIAKPSSTSGGGRGKKSAN